MNKEKKMAKTSGRPTIYGWGVMVIIGLYMVAIAAAFAGGKPPEPPTNMQEQHQGQDQHQAQRQGQGQGQHQTASAVNEGVSAIADVNQSVNTDIPKVTVALGAGSSNSAYFVNDCVVPAEGGALKRPINILGIFSMGQKQVVDPECVAFKREMARRQMALEERRLGIGNELSECQSNLLSVAEKAERCQTAFSEIAEGK